ncbi:nickel transporter permease [Aureimonas phyllosphaerae]|uniref:Peptide/nickel transport system permease protein n=1 Tax=Aureimonas phyllosphaerae TaxID=1166078 RepID=A0A7W6BT91_9HYPH|nr:nickel transporter permease [Aureimonas phyllosphaerae]MBB3937594.1 peptide/nickel transport system permease protein [Aureimonas phyllosphaerae]MBB3961606.1 peptide/nickel transport system permease protein [Aureimonas phyllosphaerae]SFF46657.1 peptide/nickel transport system permease protein [Aureimonas phyllosphaerae]
MSGTASTSTGWVGWLTTDTPRSRLQARAVSLYQGWRILSRNPLAMIGLVLIAILLLMAAFAPLLATHDPNAQNLSTRLLPPGAGHFLGTDELGRDVWSRLVYGSRVTLYVVALVALTAPVLGLVIGTVAGTLGGWTDRVLMRITDIFLAFPRLVLALAFVAALGPGIENAVLAIALTAWPPYARVARAETLTVRRSDYIAAARLQGAGTLRIITGHIMPMCLSSVIVRITLDMAGIILTAAGLGFLGLGAQPPLAEWGAMISSGRQYLLTHWWVATIPGIAILLVSLAFNLLGDALRDILDPRSGQQ